MKCEVRSVHLIDFDDGEYWPDDPTDFSVAAEAIIGPQGREGGDIFSFEVCSPRWFERNRGVKATFIRHILVMNEYDEGTIRSAVNELVNGVSGETWSEIANVLARSMFWEFEDYRA